MKLASQLFSPAKMVVGGCPQRALDLERELELLSELGSFLLLGLNF